MKNYFEFDKMFDIINKPEQNLKTDSVFIFSDDVFLGMFIKRFVKDPIQTRTATSSGTNATCNWKPTIYADHFKESSKKQLIKETNQIRR